MAEHKDRDELSGIETTGHDWDGLKELNNPAPRWWLWVFFITVIWAVGYWVVYPAWPTLSGNTKGMNDWTQYKKLGDEQREITERRGVLAEKMKHSSLDNIRNNPELYAFAQVAGKTQFRENCAACHGTGAQGAQGYPNLNDDDWLWGGTLEAIYQTLKFGIRSGHEQARLSQMPAFADVLKKEEIEQVTAYVLWLHDGQKHNAYAETGAKIFKQNCSSCHGETGRGGREFGAPNLADALWLYGGDAASIATQIRHPRHGVMPAWGERLPDETVKALSIYVHSLGGGE